MAFEKLKSAGYLANHMARIFERELRGEITPLGLAPAQFMTLLVLWHEDGLTQKQLVAQLDVEQATMANTLTRMARDGLIVRETHADDGRVRRIFLTQKAKALEVEATTAARGVNNRVMGVLSAEERDVLLGLMRRVVKG